MKLLKLVAAAALAVAVIGPPAAIAASGPEAKIAEERAAPMPAAEPASVTPATLMCSSIRVSDRYAILPARPAEICVSVPHLVSAAAGAARDRDAVAYPLRL